MNCVILQPSYIPWRGYFHQVYKADCFVFYDDVQYDSRGWRNRNRIKTSQGCHWLTVPVHSSGCQVLGTPIREIKTCQDAPWQAQHWRSLEHNYRRAPFFDRYAPRLQRFYERPWDLLCDFTIELTVALARELGIRSTRFLRSSELNVSGVRTDRLLGILTKLGATHYISGPSARAYLEEEKLRQEGITVEYMNYDYPAYPQLHPPFEGQVSILDLLFMTGPNAARFIWNQSISSPSYEDLVPSTSSF